MWGRFGNSWSIAAFSHGIVTHQEINFNKQQKWKVTTVCTVHSKDEFCFIFHVYA